MSKGANTLICKAEILAKGLKKTVSELGDYGITAETVSNLEAEIERLRLTDDAAEKQLAILTEKRRINAEARTALYEDVLSIKRTIKDGFDKSAWSRYGVEDKQ